MTKCRVCDRDAVCFTELYDNDGVFRPDGMIGIYTVFLCEKHHKQLLHKVRGDLIRMRWDEEAKE